MLCVCVLITQSCLIVCDPMDCSPLGSSVHGILQARILEWVAIPFSRGSSQPRDLTPVSHIGDRFVTIWATREACTVSYNTFKSWKGLRKFSTDGFCIKSECEAILENDQKAVRSSCFLDTWLTSPADHSFCHLQLPTVYPLQSYSLWAWSLKVLVFGCPNPQYWL